MGKGIAPPARRPGRPRRYARDPSIPETIKRACKRCGKIKLLRLRYHKRPNGKVTCSYQAHCSECILELSKLRKFGLTIADYDQLLKQQGGTCGVCGKPPTSRRFAVDHNHQTGQIRGLLCSNCNTALGLLGEDLGLIKKAYHYVKRHTQS